MINLIMLLLIMSGHRQRAPPGSVSPSSAGDRNGEETPHPLSAKYLLLLLVVVLVMLWTSVG